MSTRKKNLLSGGPKKPAGTTASSSAIPSSSLTTTLLSVAPSSSLNKVIQQKQRKIETVDSDSDEISILEPPSKKQKSSTVNTGTRSSSRKLSTGQLISDTISISQRTSPRKKQKERPTTPVPEPHPKDSRRSTAAVSQNSDIMNESIPEEDDGIMETDPETRTGSKRRPSKILVDEALHRVKKMKIATLNETDAIDLNCTVSIRNSQTSGKRFKKQGKTAFGGPSQRISSQNMVIYETKNS